ncbi:MAG: hypothetical protein AB7H88_14615 [Vicinamibacterales bacterium]
MDYFSPLPIPSSGLALGFILLPVALVAALVAGVAASTLALGEGARAARRNAALAGGAAVLWMAATWAAAESGWLGDFERNPPPFMLLAVGVIVLGVVLAMSPIGDRLARGLPLWVLVGVQAFRVPLELLMHRAYYEGLMPVQMSYEGLNFDIVTGATAVALAAALATTRVPRWLVGLWNLLGLALLVNVIVVAVLSTPRFQFFGPDHLNVWVTLAPFVWLPAVMVLAAWSGHLIIFRALVDGAREARGATKAG